MIAQYLYLLFIYVIPTDLNTLSIGGDESEAGFGNLYYNCILGALLLCIISSLSMTALVLAQR